MACFVWNINVISGNKQNERTSFLHWKLVYRQHNHIAEAGTGQPTVRRDCYH